MDILGWLLLTAPSSAPTSAPAGLPRMDSIDWCVFVVALLAVPLALRANVNWWRKSRTDGQPRDWQSFWMIATGLICMVAIACWYLVKFILPAR
ncbi:MAG: hypothetical protein PHU85_11720 [Phycisphaerae bacterium]|nr:hypothetical protein [Phycisphaerae bacterium]